MKNKFITDELITLRMTEKGWTEGYDDEHARNQVLARYECKITEAWQRPDFSIYEESTADGYSVWIATDDDKNININEDVYYYENDLSDVLYNAIPDYNEIFCDNPSLVEDAITRHYEELFDRIEEEVVDELRSEGYVNKIAAPTNALQYIEMISQDDQFTKGTPEIYDGCVSIDVNHDYKWLNYATQVIKDSNRYEIIANHYGLTISCFFEDLPNKLIFNKLKK